MMYTLSTIHVASVWILVKTGFINNGNTPLSTSLYLLQPPLWLTVLAATVFTVNTVIADFIVIWRCWIVWNRDWKVVVLPVMCTISGAALGSRSIAEQAAYVLNPNLDRSSFVDFSTPYFALSLVTTCLSTILVIWRIISITESSTRTSKGYGRVIEVVVESAILYSVSLVVFLPFLVKGSTNDGYPQAVLGIAPTLIVARVSLGIARPDATWAAPQSSLNFGRSVSTGLELRRGSAPVYNIDAPNSAPAAKEYGQVDA
ncbi:hypothetical protein MSAN_00487800 [Mycena sanguinolenta]|uniref:Uncharacterized protein n=1 Tax=Mycena sanguinolenta TaxID=230812 RepID=A0A8H6Z5Q5_9AGAR|nr:hypothetical protein MSAN_00487800 [Mycena sanguinolenta]